MKIPTLLGFALIITLIALAGLYYYYRPQPAQPIEAIVSNLEAVNIADTFTTIVWQTSYPVTGQVVYSSIEPLPQTAPDNRDRGLSRPRQIHFATLTNLKPDTKYKYQVKNNSVLFPSNPLEFKTAKAIQTLEDPTFSFIKPLKGTVLNTNLNPIDESLIFLQIPGVQKLATFSSTAGNFILPLKTVLSEDLSQLFIIPPDTRARINIVKGSLKSDIQIIISEGTMNLPPIPIGSNLDLVNFKHQPITNITLTVPTSSGMDFNSDGKINSLDLALLRETADPKNLRGSSGKSKFDINGDGVVDQNDVDAFSKALTGKI